MKDFIFWAFVVVVVMGAITPNPYNPKRPVLCSVPQIIYEGEMLIRRKYSKVNDFLRIVESAGNYSNN